MDGNIFGMDMTLTIDAINAILEGTRYVSDATLAFDCKATADLDSMKFTFDENKLTFAGLPLAFDGYVQLCDSSTAMDLKLAALETSFKTILDLVPDEMLADVEGLQTSGSLCLYAKATGEFVDMDNIPALDAVLLIKDGYAQYPDLPKSLNDINVSVVVNNPGGSADLTTVAVDTFHIELGGNPFDITAHVYKPISNPNFDFSMVGTLDLGSLKDALPLDSISIAGVLTANLTVASDLASIEAEKYDQVNANGTVGLTNFSFANADIPNGVTISKALLTFTPKVVNLNPLAVALGSSDFSLTGNVQNYLAYVLSDGTVTGSATLTSSLIDCNELLALAGDSEETADEVAEEEASESSDAIEIPTNINFAFTTSINKLVYDNLEMTNVAGAVTLKDGIATLSNLSMNACDGKFALNGSFQTPKNANSKANMKIDMTNVSLVKLMSSFDVIDSLMPIAKSATGNITLGLAVTTEMDSELSPVLNTVNGTASFSSSSISLKDSEFQTKLANLLSNDSYTDLTLKDLKIKGTITDGNITITPFTLALLGKTATFSGSQNLDQSMAYNLSVPVSRSEISTLISKAGINVSSFSTSGSDINVGVNIGGTLTSPELSLDSDGIISALKSEVTTAVVETASEVADNLIESIQNETVKEAVSNVKSTITNLLKK